MQRKIIFKDTESGTELVLPVTPEGYDIEHGRKANSLTMHEIGDVNLPGTAILLDWELECLLPAHDYPFNQPGANLNPFVYLEKLEKWSDAGTVLRVIVSDTPVNAAVILDPIRYREQDGTNDIYCTIPLRGYRQLAAETTEKADTGNAARATETPPEKQDTYTVQAGDTLSGIARKFYGDASLYGKLAAVNGIKNPDIIHVGQILKLPDADKLPPANPPSRSRQAAAATKSTYKRTPVNSGFSDAVSGWELKLPQAEATKFVRPLDASSLNTFGGSK